MSKNKVWLVTGASKGLGLSLVKKLLDQGYRVAGTSRTAASMVEAVGEKSERFLPLELDITDDAAVKNAIAELVSHFGSVDVIVNNAGYGLIGTLEELSDEEARRDFDVNVFGSLNVIRNAMPYLREQGSGHIFNIASIGGFFGGFPGWGIYCATKFAVAGFTESLAEEVKEFGVRATVVYPGYFRTNFLSKGSILTPENPIAAYQTARDSENMHLQQMDGQQANDPEKAADALIAVSLDAAPPVHLFLGADAYTSLYKKMDLVKADVEKWKEVTQGTGL